MKYFFILLLFTITNCGPTIKNQSSPLYKKGTLNTEIYCPNSGYRILLLSTDSQEVHEAIMQALYEQSASENYKKVKFTILNLSGDRKTSIYNTTAHELLTECRLIEFYRTPQDEVM